MFGNKKLKSEIKSLKSDLDKAREATFIVITEQQKLHLDFEKSKKKLEETISHYEKILSDCYVRDSKGRFKRFGDGNIFLSFKVYKKDLIGSLKNFPIEIVELMLKRQYEQKGNTDIKIFQDSRFSSRWGFRWDLTEEGYNFWAEVISRKNFNLFYEKYPKKK